MMSLVRILTSIYKKGKKLWSDAKSNGKAANPLPQGVFSIEGEAIPFHRYSSVLTLDQSVVVSARMNATHYEGNTKMNLIRRNVFCKGHSYTNSGC